MAHADNSLITGNFRGSLGKEIVFREWEGKTVVAKSPKSRSGDPKVTQTEIQEKFLMASHYAKSIPKSADQTMAQGYESQDIWGHSFNAVKTQIYIATITYLLAPITKHQLKIGTLIFMIVMTFYDSNLNIVINPLNPKNLRSPFSRDYQFKHPT